jgi:hypothetical protein
MKKNILTTSPRSTKKKNHNRTPSWLVSSVVDRDLEEALMSAPNYFVFGSSTETILKREDHKQEMVPKILKDCSKILILDEKNLKTDGIFRQSPTLSELIEISKLYDEENAECIFIFILKSR